MNNHGAVRVRSVSFLEYGNKLLILYEFILTLSFKFWLKFNTTNVVLCVSSHLLYNLFCQNEDDSIAAIETPSYNRKIYVTWEFQKPIRTLYQLNNYPHNEWHRYKGHITFKSIVSILKVLQNCNQTCFYIKNCIKIGYFFL